MERKEAIEVIKKNWPDSSFTMLREALETLVPELKESEDERIRKHLIAVVELYYGNTDEQEKKDCLAWLEKQSTPQVRTGLEWVNTIDDACDKRYAEEYAHGEYCHEQSFKWGFQEGVAWLEKQREQKPAEWSEEDEKQARQIERIVHDDGCTQKLQKQIADWFKSLKERCNWKPSDEQMKVLNDVMNHAADSEKPHWNDYIYNVLKDLIKQLKKL